MISRVRESLQAEAWAEEIKTISDGELSTHEAIGRARLQMQSRMYLVPKLNAAYQDKPNGVQVNVGLHVVLPKADRIKLLERRDKALIANCSSSAKEDEVFRNDLTRAREAQADVWAEEVKEITDGELATHEDIGRARLRMQSRHWLAGKYSSTYADKPNGVQVNVGLQVVLPEADRVKLLERRDKALLAAHTVNTASTPEALPR
jgi:hypothetical protein